MIRIEVHGVLQMRVVASSNFFGGDTQRLAPLVGLGAECVAAGSCSGGRAPPV